MTGYGYVCILELNLHLASESCKATAAAAGRNANLQSHTQDTDFFSGDLPLLPFTLLLQLTPTNRLSG